MGEAPGGGPAATARMGVHGSEYDACGWDHASDCVAVDKLMLFGGDAGGQVFLNDLYVMEFSKGKGAR